MKRYSKLLAVLIAVAMILPGVAQAALVETTTNGIEVHRLGGVDRVGTAVLASKAAYPGGSNAVVLAGFNGEVDALTGTLLAGDKDAPLLITRQASLSPETKDEIARLGAKTVYILGEESVVSAAVKTELEGLVTTVKRIGGSNRDQTAVNVAKEVKGTSANHVFLALGRPATPGDALADALAIGPVSAMNDMPVLLTKKDMIPATTVTAMSDLNVNKVTIIGGTSAITSGVQSTLTSLGYTVDRIGESGREATALKIAETYFTNPSNLIVAYGRKSADALVGGYLGNKMKAPILLTDAAGLKANTAAYITANPLKTYILGGTTVITDSVLQQVVTALEGGQTKETAAKSAVELAETSLLQVDKDAAQLLVDALNAGTIKNALLARLDVVQDKIDLAADLTVSSVNAISATRIEVKFSKPIDKASAAAATYGIIALDSQSSPATSLVYVETKADNKTVILQANNALTKRYRIGMTPINSKDNANIKTDVYDEILNITADTTAPSVLSVDRISSNRLKVNFSEPVQGGTITAKYSDGSSITGMPSLSVSNTDELVIDLFNSNITENKNIIITFNGLTDMAGNLINPQPSTVTVAKLPADGIEPAITSVTQTGAKKFLIKFNKDLDGTLATTNSTTANNNVKVTNSPASLAQSIEKISASEYEVTVNNNLNGLQTVRVMPNKAIDLSGQKNTLALTKLVTFTEDTVAPVVLSTSVVKDMSDGFEYLEMKFDKDVNLASGAQVSGATTNGSYVKNYVTTTIGNSNFPNAPLTYKSAGDKTIVRFKLSTLLASVFDFKDAKYTLNLDLLGVTSLSGVAATDPTVIFTRNEDNIPVNTNVVAVTSVSQGTDNNKVEVLFDMAVDGASAIVPANYNVSGAVVDSVTLVAANKAVLNLQPDSNTFTGNRNMIIKNVKALGSTVNMVTTTKVVNLTQNVRSTITKAEITAASKIKLTFSENIVGTTITDNNDFEVYVDGTKATISSVVGSFKEWTINFTNPVITDLSKPVTVKILPTNDIRDGEGNSISTSGTITAVQ